MIYYTVQKLKAWEEAKKKGYLTGNESFSEEWLSNSYKWMQDQMSKRLKNYKGEVPIWVWLDLSNICFTIKF